MSETPPRTWRTNVGLRLTADDGAWFEAICESENRSFSNYVELLIKRERAAWNRRATPAP